MNIKELYSEKTFGKKMNKLKADGWPAFIKPNRLTLAYFSGTGCTKMVCECFAKQFAEHGISSRIIDIADHDPMEAGQADLLMIFSPVYAFRLVSIVEEWVEKLPSVPDASAVVISVSAGGEISPNTACRVRTKRLLKSKGYAVIYEKMIVMPLNLVYKDEKLNRALIAVLPARVKQIVSDILSGHIQLSRPKLRDRLFAAAGKAEHSGARSFGASISASSECNSCGICARDCPQKNISMFDGIPKFGNSCIACLKCIYACPKYAISPGKAKFAIIKDGFDLKKMSEMPPLEPGELDYGAYKKLIWKGVIGYLDPPEKPAGLLK